MRVRTAKLRRVSSLDLGGTSSMLNQNTLSLSAGKGSPPVRTKRTTWLLSAFKRAIGGVKLNGVDISSGEELALPSSSHICTNEGVVLDELVILKDTSRRASG